MKKKKWYILPPIIFATFCLTGSAIYLKDNDKSLTTLDKQEHISTTKISTQPDSLAAWNAANLDDIANLKQFDIRKYPELLIDSDRQKSDRLCWSQSTSNTLEINLAKNGIKDGDQPIHIDDANLEWISKNRTLEADKLGLTYYDLRESYTNVDVSSAMRGSVILSQRMGPTKQGDAPAKGYGIPACDLVNGEFIDGIVDSSHYMKIKQMVAKFGSCTFILLMPKDFVNTDGYVYVNYWSAKNAVMGSIVGWNDEIPPSMFKGTSQPKNPGAWLVKTATKNDKGKYDYYWLSYESTYQHISSYQTTSYGQYMNNYYYDGIYKEYADETYNNYPAAVIFPVQKAWYNRNELLEAINVGLAGTNIDINVKIYTGINADFVNRTNKRNNPIAGNLVYDKSYQFESDGVYTIKLDKQIPLTMGDFFSVVITPNNKTTSTMFSSEEFSYNDMSYINYEGNWVCSFNAEKQWYGIARIKALTNDYATTGKELNDVRKADVTLSKRMFVYGAEDRIPLETVTYEGRKLIRDKDYTVNRTEEFIAKTQDGLKDTEVVGYGSINIVGKDGFVGTKQVPYAIRLGSRPNPKGIGYYPYDYDSNKKTWIKLYMLDTTTNFNEVNLPDDWEFIYKDFPIYPHYPEHSEEHKSHNYIKYKDWDAIYYHQSFFDADIEWIPTTDKSDLAKATITIGKYNDVYNGFELRPDITVSLGGTTLNPATDYDVFYTNNVEAGENTAQVIVSGKGEYRGRVIKSFPIKQADNFINTFIIHNRIPIATAKFGEPTFEYYSDAEGKNVIARPEGDDAHYYVAAKVDETKNWKACKSEIKEIGKLYVPEVIKDLNQATIEIIGGDKHRYTTRPIEPAITVSINGLIVPKSKYSVDYQNNTEIGTATITINALDDYTGSKQKNFTIIKGINKILNFSTEGGKPSATCVDGVVSFRYYKDEYGKEPISTPKQSGTYYVEAVSPNTAKYESDVSELRMIKIKVDPIPINDATVSLINEYVYNGSPIIPNFHVTVKGIELKIDEDFYVRYSDNVNAGTCQYEIVGIEPYEGTISGSFTIKKAVNYITKLEIDSDNNVIAECTNGHVQITYYYDLELKDPVEYNTPTYPGYYYVKAITQANDKKNYIESEEIKGVNLDFKGVDKVIWFYWIPIICAGVAIITWIVYAFIKSKFLDKGEVWR